MVEEGEQPLDHVGGRVAGELQLVAPPRTVGLARDRVDALRRASAAWAAASWPRRRSSATASSAGLVAAGADRRLRGSLWPFAGEGGRVGLGRDRLPPTSDCGQGLVATRPWRGPPTHGLLLGKVTGSGSVAAAASPPNL